jgi:hypothetical protein
VADYEIEINKNLFVVPCCVSWWDILPSLVLWRNENNLSKNNWLRGVILIFLIYETIFIVWGISFSIVLVPRYELSLCHTHIKADLLGFLRIVGFTREFLDRVFKRFKSFGMMRISPPPSLMIQISPTSSVMMCIMGIIIHLVKLKLICKRIQMVQWYERERNNYKGPWRVKLELKLRRS